MRFDINIGLSTVHRERRAKLWRIYLLISNNYNFPELTDYGNLGRTQTLGRQTGSMPRTFGT